MDSETPQSKKISVVDLGQLGLGRETEPSQEEWQRVAQQLHQAFTDIGCAYLTNHGVPDDQVSRLLVSGADFFSLNRTKKDEFAHNLETNSGYISPQTESINDEELNEGFIVKTGEEDLPDKEVPSFRPALTSLLEYYKALSTRVMKAVALSLGKEKEWLVSMHQELGSRNGLTCLRVNHYPAVPATVADGAVRFAAHSDFGTLTFLFQDDAGGLQVQDRQGVWQDAVPVPGAVLVMVGDFLKFNSDDKFIAAVHRVVVPKSDERRTPARNAIIYFVIPDGHLPMAPEGSSSTVNRLEVRQYLYQQLNNIYIKRE
nr:2-oxoglutarate-Fe(II) type oxidoreductase ppzD-like [Procambarus clarkii]XP_045614835.1 2-oxoglutarate-Fe(II) type oxidoreductase ppzD-like [Procambarus clarkii]XP_045614837.1 2-oxoglutarate-Fe(II) type oxidoreductase ppzD-like [Procambarus clarkii]